MSEPAGTNSPPAGDISRLADHLFRHESGKLVSVLTGIFGIDRLQFAEDVVQEALVRALQTWPYYGVPKNPAAWLTQTAKNLALDLIRREKVFQEKQPQIISFIEQWSSDAEVESPTFDNEIKDRRLRLMFSCCHPQIPFESQTALALKTLCGLSPSEIARAFLTSEAAIAKRLTRARQRIHELHIPFEIPEGQDIPGRLDGVLQTLYLLFNEGYKASSGSSLIREDLCREAIRLVTLLAGHPVGNQAKVHALAALMFLNGSRLPARIDADGNLLLLKEQDRSLWDKKMIAQGMSHLIRSAAGGEVSDYHLQAGVSAIHCAAPDYDSTDWSRILALYDRLVAIDNSPVVALNRAVAVGQVLGPKEGKEALEQIADSDTLSNYYLYHAVRGNFEFLLGQLDSAQSHFRKALQLTGLESERQFLLRKVQICQAPVEA